MLGTDAPGPRATDEALPKCLTALKVDSQVGLQVPVLLEQRRHPLERLISAEGLHAVGIAVPVERGECNVPTRVGVQVSLLNSNADVHCSPSFPFVPDS